MFISWCRRTMQQRRGWPTNEHEWIVLQKRYKEARSATSCFCPQSAPTSPKEPGPIRAARYGEQMLGAVATNLTVLRPCYFMDNWAPVLGAAKGQGVLPTFIAHQAMVPMISTSDIGRVGAEQLMVGGKGKQIIELAGPAEYSPNDVAVALGQILGKPVTAQHAPLSAVVPTFKSFGFSDEAAKLFEEMYTSFSTGAIGYEHPASVFGVG